MNPRAKLLTTVLFALAAAPALPQAESPAAVGSTASVTVGTGPYKGKYDFAPTQACVIAAFGKRPMGVSVVLSSTSASLSIDMPSIDEKHANEIQVVLVVADQRPGQSPKSKASVTYEIDTRPDAVLEPYQKAERANKGMSGKATTTLMQQNGRVLVSFSGETKVGVKLDGEITCHKAG